MVYNQKLCCSWKTTVEVTLHDNTNPYSGHWSSFYTLALGHDSPCLWITNALFHNRAL